MGKGPTPSQVSRGPHTHSPPLPGGTTDCRRVVCPLPRSRPFPPPIRSPACFPPVTCNLAASIQEQLPWAAPTEGRGRRKLPALLGPASGQRRDRVPGEGTGSATEQTCHHGVSVSAPHSILTGLQEARTCRPCPAALCSDQRGRELGHGTELTRASAGRKLFTPKLCLACCPPASQRERGRDTRPWTGARSAGLADTDEPPHGRESSGAFAWQHPRV